MQLSITAGRGLHQTFCAHATAGSNCKGLLQSRHTAKRNGPRYLTVSAKSASTGREWQQWLGARIAPFFATAAMLAAAPSLQAADLASVGTCLLRNCQLELAQCLGDANCLKNVICLNSCNGQPDETGCQIRCGDLYEDKSVNIFNSCAVSNKKCVPERVTEGLYPVPPDCAVDTSFNPVDYQGRWFITAGYNQLFDTFDCQVHYFASPSPDKMMVKINWRIDKPDGDFIERSTMQSFRQADNKPGILLNHGNEYLHYEDDWYIVKSKKDAYFFVYYKGNNDAWKGYGGAVVYTRAASLPPELVPELRQAAESVGLDWEQFKLTDNTCPPHPPPRTLTETLKEDVEVLEKDVEALEKNLQTDVQIVEKDFETSLRSFGRGFTVLENNVLRELTTDEKLIQQEISQEFAQAEGYFKTLEDEFAREFALAPGPSGQSLSDVPLPVWGALGALAAAVPLAAARLKSGKPGGSEGRKDGLNSAPGKGKPSSNGVGPRVTGSKKLAASGSPGKKQGGSKRK